MLLPMLRTLCLPYVIFVILFIVGAIDPVQMTQMAENQEVLYVSGWACSSVLTSTNEVSPDLGDYPYNTVPNQVQRLFKAQQLHDRRHWDARRSLTKEQREKTPYIDYMRPIIADADTGHGGLSAVLKLAKLFAESGAAAIHLEDQMHGGKKVWLLLFLRPSSAVCPWQVSLYRFNPLTELIAMCKHYSAVIFLEKS